MDAVIKKFVSKSNENSKPTREEAELAVRTLISWIGENPEREGLVDTPKRVVKAFEELFGGYDENPIEQLERTFEEVSGYDEAVTMRDISFFSHCEHHMVPIIGKAHVTYIPDGRVVGLSKIARVVDIYAKRLQTQESMTAQIADAITTTLKPKGVGVVIEAEHMCMAMRGIRKLNATTTTSKFTGLYKDDVNEQLKFMTLIGKD